MLKDNNHAVSKFNDYKLKDEMTFKIEVVYKPYVDQVKGKLKWGL